MDHLFIAYICDQPDDLSIIYSPFCKPLVQNQLTKHDVMSIFEILKQLYEIGIIHRDLSYSNFMRTSKNNVILIDFGSAIWVDVDEQLNNSNMSADSEFCKFHGSVEFASDDILYHLANPTK